MLTRRDLLTAIGLAAASGLFLSMGNRLARAHHGWAWATDSVFEITGKITAVKLGNPHGELILDVNGESWEAEIGQPWRNERAGLTDALLAVGTEVTVSGRRAKDPAQKLVKAEIVTIAGKAYNLYPDRRS
ncbi:MAG: DUF6152 family protein [Pseudomonadota bacterium]|nr:DUF6152 family protein [Pseudomonadota bacterium]